MNELQPPDIVLDKQPEHQTETNSDNSSGINSSDISVDVNQIEQKQSSYPTQKPGKSWLWMILLLSVAANGFALWSFISPLKQTPEPIANAAQTPPPRPVEVTRLARGNSTRRIQLLGQVESPQRATIRAQTGGVITQVLKQAGDRITPGMTIAVIDDADQKLALSQAQAQLAQQRNNLARLEVGTRPEIIAQRQAAVSSAKAREQEAMDNLQRQTALVKEGAIAQRVLVQARTAVDDRRGERLEAEAELAEAQAGPTREEIAAQRANMAAAVAAVNQAKLGLERTNIRASSGGVVLERQVSPGDYVQTGNEILTLVAGERLDIFLELPENLSGRVPSGSRVVLTARALPQWRGNATITGVVPSAEAASRRQRVRVRLDNPPQGLLPGMAISANLELPGNTPSFVVSRDALTRRQNQWFVFAVENGQAKQLEVEMVADMGEQVAIASNELQNGKPIVLKGGDGLRDGAVVKPL
ncbi:efflux RND transporter periplasmic adaptor subunit [Mastigocoleus testarum]|uniref:efflux RND transporter periplasmic adaptor subunit n=1 Tax=Mastigocoleus testarum TaxID=996925 RepID=UPI000407B696|nr:efflux RND transporter periplasmic adaptor subunit [Mastigocoleus testarum]